jgi:magnesium-transporting ATPase (P-type)
VTIGKIVENDIILVRNNEFIPTDAVLKKEKSIIDYSFVTDESKSSSYEKQQCKHSMHHTLIKLIFFNDCRSIFLDNLTRDLF